MSNIYIQEPHTNGKVVIETSSGEIEIELWSKEAPKTCRNFIQLCLEGYYVGTVFHRVVPNFIVQGGDPTGTGTGGESIYGEPFVDEFHSRLRFIRRGLVAMANSGVNQNGSQFFFTLDRTDELQNKHTIFGKVVGDTIFNVLKIGEGETDEDERPLYPTTIKATRVISNPFDDIVPRITIEEKIAMEAAKATQAKVTTKKKAKKNLALLSFGEEAEEFENVPVKKIQSSHDVLDDPRLSKEVLIQTNEEVDQKLKKLEETKDYVRQIEQKVKPTSAEKQVEGNKEEEQVSAQEFDRMMRDQVKRRHKNSSSSEEEDSDGEPRKKPNKSSSTQSAIEKLTSDIRKIDQSREKIQDRREQTDKKKKVSLLELERQKYQTSSKAIVGKSGRKGRSEEETLAKLSAFTSKLWSAPVEETKTKDEMEKELEGQLCMLHSVPHCLSCNDTFGQQVEETDEGWLSHKLIFTKDLKGKDLMQRKDDINDYVVIDPRARKEQALEEDKKKRDGKNSISTVFRSDSRKREKGDDRDSDRYRSRGDRDRRDRDRDRYDSRRR
ncbi:Peptidyl-prolyl isomerase cwc27 [Basidiobolus ranarum]|uniref:Peptidyl-prolyl isomerase cwc27 n=1 Tax=Basidiobolus ranarum TaxID=34480 RepID=A0ABR2W4M8_9FUNG